MTTELPPAIAPAKGPMPRVWKTVLVVSLALNLLIGGAAVARFFTHEPHERFIGASYAQLVPRRFFADLGKERRGELLGILRQYRQDFTDGRTAAKRASVKLADALEASPYDAEKVTAAIQDYAATGHHLVDRGTAAAVDFLGRLTEQERHMMALRLRQRAGLPDDEGSAGGPGGG
jgi:uncharacterized membrane protein